MKYKQTIIIALLLVLIAPLSFAANYAVVCNYYNPFTMKLDCIPANSVISGGNFTNPAGASLNMNGNSIFNVLNVLSTRSLNTTDLNASKGQFTSSVSAPLILSSNLINGTDINGTRGWFTGSLHADTITALTIFDAQNIFSANLVNGTDVNGTNGYFSTLLTAAGSFTTPSALVSNFVNTTNLNTTTLQVIDDVNVLSGTLSVLLGDVLVTSGSVDASSGTVSALEIAVGQDAIIERNINLSDGAKIIFADAANEYIGESNDAIQLVSFGSIEAKIDNNGDNGQEAKFKVIDNAVTTRFEVDGLGYVQTTNNINFTSPTANNVTQLGCLVGINGATWCFV